jgi:hypothetical protein
MFGALALCTNAMSVFDGTSVDGTYESEFAAACQTFYSISKYKRVYPNFISQKLIDLIYNIQVYKSKCSNIATSLY